LKRESNDLLKEFSQVTRVFGPMWNFIDSIGVLYDAKKDYQNA